MISLIIFLILCSLIVIIITSTVFLFSAVFYNKKIKNMKMEDNSLDLVSYIIENHQCVVNNNYYIYVDIESSIVRILDADSNETLSIDYNADLIRDGYRRVTLYFEENVLKIVLNKITSEILIYKITGTSLKEGPDGFSIQKDAYKLIRKFNIQLRNDDY